MPAALPLNLSFHDMVTRGSFHSYSLYTTCSIRGRGFSFSLARVVRKAGNVIIIIVNNVREGLTRFPLCVYRFTVILIGNRPRGASVLRYCKLVNRVRILGKLCRPLFISRLDDTRPMINDIHRSAAFCRELSDVDYREIA